MTDISHWAGLLSGMLAGFVHATLLWRGVHRLSAWAPVLGMLRLASVAAILVVAAVFGQILTASIGWVVCFSATVLILWCVRLQPRCYPSTQLEKVAPQERSDAKCT